MPEHEAWNSHVCPRLYFHRFQRFSHGLPVPRTDRRQEWRTEFAKVERQIPTHADTDETLTS